MILDLFLNAEPDQGCKRQLDVFANGLLVHWTVDGVSPFFLFFSFEDLDLSRNVICG